MGSTGTFRPICRVVALGGSAVMVLLGLAGDASGGTLRPLIGLGWLALGAEAIALGSALWDDRVRGLSPGSAGW